MRTPAEPAAQLQDDLRATQLDRLGGHLALDFVNTAEFRGTERHVEVLTSAQRVLAWARHVGLLDDAQLRLQVRQLVARASPARPLLAQALALREALYQVLVDRLQGRPLAPARLKPLTQLLQRVAAQRELQVHGDRVCWAWATGSDASARVLGPVALAAAELLTGDHLHKLKQCGNCGWLFLDTSRNGMRRWCSMQVCGSAIKSQRQYQRKKQGRSAGAAAPGRP